MIEIPSSFDGLTGYDLGSSSLSGSIGCNLKGFPPLATDPGFLEDSDNQMPTCLKRAFSNLKLYCMANGLQVAGIRNFTVQNMHAARNAFPWVGCKGSDTIVILKWLSFYGSLQLQQEGWSPKNQQLLRWIVAGAKGGLSFGQGIHGHGIWLAPSCVSHLKRAVQKFGSAYAYLAHHCLKENYSLFGQVPKLHAWMHYREECKDSLDQRREYKLNPAVFDNSMSEDFIGKISRQSRRISARNMERNVLKAYKVKTKITIQRFCKRYGMHKA